MTDGRIERGVATRERLIDAGRELFGERGFDATSIGAILERAGVARGALYHHFASKEKLFDAVLERTVAELAAAAAAAARETSDPLEGLQAGLERWLGLVLDPALQRIVLVDPPAVVGWERVRALDERDTLTGVRRSLESIGRDARLSASEVDLLAQMLLAAVGELALAVAHADDQERALSDAKSAIRTLLQRLAAPPPEAPAPA